MGIVYGVIVGKRHDSRTATWGMFGFLEVLVAEALAVLKTIELINKFQDKRMKIHSDVKSLISA